MSVAYVVFFNDTATTEIYTLSLHDALPIYRQSASWSPRLVPASAWTSSTTAARKPPKKARASGWESSSARLSRSEEHTSELQSRQYLVCRLLLEKKKHEPNARRTDLCLMPL